MKWIRGALRGEVQRVLREAEEAEQAGDRQDADRLRGIAAEWDEVYENSRNAERKPARPSGRHRRSK